MILASVKPQNPSNRNGDLVVVSKDHKQAVKIKSEIAHNLLHALENWKEVKPKLEKISQSLAQKDLSGIFDLDLGQCLAPITHAPGFYDGSAFLSHVHRARRARGDKLPESAKITPLMYQGVSDYQLPHNAPIQLMDEKFGGDFEGELAVILTDVPKGTRSKDIAPYIALYGLFNDITYREILKTEIETKFGFLQSKPNSAWAPFVVTPEELGNDLIDGRLQLDICVTLNGKSFGNPNGKEMHFSFSDLVAHACRTRPLAAGNLLGTGTVSNEDLNRGFACLTEKRYQEVIDSGSAQTPWLKPGDHLVIDVKRNGLSVFGSIDQYVSL